MARDIVWTCCECGFPIPDDAGALSVPTPYTGQEELEWHAFHDACLTDCDRYSIPVEQLRTPAGIVRWTAHLYAKNWAHETDWHHVIDAAVPYGSEAIV